MASGGCDRDHGWTGGSEAREWTPLDSAVLDTPGLLSIRRGPTSSQVGGTQFSGKTTAFGISEVCEARLRCILCELEQVT